MSIDSDFDADVLITLLAGPLPPHLVAVFRRAAEDAIALASCWGEGAVYRAVAVLQRDGKRPYEKDRYLEFAAHADLLSGCGRYCFDDRDIW